MIKTPFIVPAVKIEARRDLIGARKITENSSHNTLENIEQTNEYAKYF